MKLKLRRTEVEVSYTLLCLVAVSILLGVWRDFLWCAAAIAVHESGHLAALAALGCFPQKIKLAPFSIDIADNTRSQRSLRQNAVILFFGPFANFICVLPCYLVYLSKTPVVLPLLAANVSVGMFNLLPALSLDGGMLLYLLLSRRLSHTTAVRVVHVCTVVCLVPLTALGVMLVTQSRNPSLLFVSAYLGVTLAVKRGQDIQ